MFGYVIWGFRRTLTRYGAAGQEALDCRGGVREVVGARGRGVKSGAPWRAIQGRQILRGVAPDLTPPLTGSSAP